MTLPRNRWRRVVQSDEGKPKHNATRRNATGIQAVHLEHTPRGVLPKTPVVLGKALKSRLVLIFWL